MARQVLENGVILPAEYSDDWYDDMTSNLTKLDDVIGSDSEKLSSADVGAAALSNNYNDLDNLPTIPTVNDATLTIQKNGVDVQTFTANASSNVTANITVPTKTSDLTNDSNFVDTSNPAVASGITSAKVTDYDAHIADTDIHVTASDKTNWNAVTSKANDSDVVHKSGDETVGGKKTFTDSITFSSVNIADVRWKSLVNQTIDLNDCYINRVGTISGYYSASVSSGSNISNKADNTAFIMLSLTTRYISVSDYQIYQFFYGSNNKKYTRTCSNGTWTAWINDTDKFVTTDTAQTVSGNKTFSSNVNVYNSDSATDTANIVLKNSKAERGSTTNIGEQTIFFLDKDNAQIGNIKCEVDSYGASTLSIQCTNPSNSSSGIRLRRTSAGTFLQPTFNNGCNLGTSGYKWYDVQTRAVNNLEPSSLSLPDLSNGIDISSYIDVSQTSTNNYTPPANGWISITITTSIRGSVQIKCGSGFRSCVYSCTDPDNPSDFITSIIIPCVKNDTVTIYFRSSSGGTINYAKFYPCQGNV